MSDARLYRGIDRGLFQQWLYRRRPYAGIPVCKLCSGVVSQRNKLGVHAGCLARDLAQRARTKEAYEKEAAAKSSAA